MNRILLKLEGLLIGVLSIWAYSVISGDWRMFALLILIPDLSMLGYLAGKDIGAKTYNIIHSYLLPVGLGVVGFINGDNLLLSLAFIWTAHIGIDRVLGYGLKYAEGFKVTHFEKI